MFQPDLFESPTMRLRALKSEATLTKRGSLEQSSIDSFVILLRICAIAGLTEKHLGRNDPDCFCAS